MESHRLKLIIPPVITVTLFFAAFVCLGQWWFTGFSWEAEIPPPWYCAPLYVGSFVMLIGSGISLLWTMWVFVKAFSATAKNG
jgi:hypothetical protein